MKNALADQPILRLERLTHRLTDKEKDEHYTVYVERPIEFVSGDFIGLLGPSGCGKTTLLTILGLLRSPSHPESIEKFELFVPGSGPVDNFERVDLGLAWKQRKLNLIETLRCQHFGFALQSGELISSLTVRENIAMPLRLNGHSTQRASARVEELIGQFRLNRVRDDEKNARICNGTESNKEDQVTDEPVGSHLDRNALANSRINRLSGGEYQRVALARAIAHKPSVVFVDEPTSALNRELAYGALSVMRDLQQNRERAGITFMITHDETLAEEFCNVIVRMAPRKNEPAGEVVEIVRTAKRAETPDEFESPGTTELHS